MNTRCIMIIMIGIMISIPFNSFAIEHEYLPTTDKFKVCDNKGGSGFFWIDTTNGKTWRLEPEGMELIYCGQPEGALSGPAGTYMPYENKDGKGLFILNTATGEGWYVSDAKWKKLNMPATKNAQQSELRRNRKSSYHFHKDDFRLRSADHLFSKGIPRDQRITAYPMYTRTLPEHEKHTQ
ncbi:MAG: hypothetical protein ACMUJM_16525 [bacterium]